MSDAREQAAGVPPAEGRGRPAETPIEVRASGTTGRPRSLRTGGEANEKPASDAREQPPQASAGEPPSGDQDAPWHRTRILARLSRYALEVLGPSDGWPDAARLHEAARALDRHREAAAAASAARTPRITPATAYALGVLHSDQRSEAEAARYAFSILWQEYAPG